MATENTPKKSMTMWYIVAAIVIIVVIVVGVFLYEQSLSPGGGGGGGGGTPLTFYGGEINGGATYAFGTSAGSLTSPGPTLNLVQGQSYTVTFHNVGTMSHSWEISNTNTGTPAPLFNSEVNPGAYVAQGQSGSVTFTPTQTGNFYYACPIAGHSTLGMWGNVVITAGP